MTSTTKFLFFPCHNCLEGDMHNEPSSIFEWDKNYRKYQRCLSTAVFFFLISFRPDCKISVRLGILRAAPEHGVMGHSGVPMPWFSVTLIDCHGAAWFSWHYAGNMSAHLFSHTRKFSACLDRPFVEQEYPRLGNTQSVVAWRNSPPVLFSCNFGKCKNDVIKNSAGRMLYFISFRKSFQNRTLKERSKQLLILKVKIDCEFF